MNATARYTQIVQAEGYRHLGDWGVKHGFNRCSTYRTVKQWGDRTKTPQGGINRQIMSALRELEAKHAA